MCSTNLNEASSPEKDKIIQNILGPTFYQCYQCKEFIEFEEGKSLRLDNPMICPECSKTFYRTKDG